MGARAGVEVEIRQGQLQVVEEGLRHLLVIVLPRVDDLTVHSRVASSKPGTLGRSS